MKNITHFKFNRRRSEGKVEPTALSVAHYYFIWCYKGRQ
jgi:hypothetical protein